VLELEPRQLSGLLRAQQLGRGTLGEPEEALGVRAAVLRFGGLGLINANSRTVSSCE
jgi:hypothetical protein